MWKNSGILVAPHLLQENGMLSEPLCVPVFYWASLAVSGFLALSSFDLALGVAGRGRYSITSFT